MADHHDAGARSPATNRSSRSSPSRSRSLVGSSSRKTSYRLSSSEARPARAACAAGQRGHRRSSRTASPRSATAWSARSSRSAPPRASQRSSASAYSSSAPGAAVGQRLRWRRPARRWAVAHPGAPGEEAAHRLARTPLRLLRQVARRWPRAGTAHLPGSGGRARRAAAARWTCRRRWRRPGRRRRPGATTRSRPENSERSPCPAARSRATRVALMNQTPIRPRQSVVWIPCECGAPTPSWAGPMAG